MFPEITPRSQSLLCSSPTHKSEEFPIVASSPGMARFVRAADNLSHDKGRE